MKEFNRFRIILCRPSEGGNVGAVCRAMKTMGFSRLSIVSPERDLDLDQLTAMAVHALDVWEAAEHYDGLEAALSGTALSVGATRRRGRWRKAFSLPVQEFAVQAWERAGEIGIVFGNERTGLTGEELSLCNLAVSIPSSDDFPSLNLAQAVQVFTWELFRARPGALLPTPSPVTHADASRMAALVADRMEASGFFRWRERGPAQEFLRDVCLRASLSSGEMDLLQGLFMKSLSLARGLPSEGVEARLDGKEDRP